jgi:hypothetical protein
MYHFYFPEDQEDQEDLPPPPPTINWNHLIAILTLASLVAIAFIIHKASTQHRRHIKQLTYKLAFSFLHILAIITSLSPMVKTLQDAFLFFHCLDDLNTPNEQCFLFNLRPQTPHIIIVSIGILLFGWTLFKFLQHMEDHSSSTGFSSANLLGALTAVSYFIPQFNLFSFETKLFILRWLGDYLFATIFHLKFVYGFLTGLSLAAFYFKWVSKRR